MNPRYVALLLAWMLPATLSSNIRVDPPQETVSPIPGGGLVVEVPLNTIFSSPLVRFDTVKGPILVELFSGPEVAVTVENFLKYVDAGVYDDSIIHVSWMNRYLQGGGYRRAAPDSAWILDLIDPIADPIPVEYHHPNERGTIAMAHGGADHPATSSWFFNTFDNTGLLGPNANSETAGFTVFGRVADEAGMGVLDALQAIPSGKVVHENEEGVRETLFDNFPWFDEEFIPENFVWIHSVKRTLEFELGGAGPWGERGVAFQSIDGDVLRLNFRTMIGGDDHAVVIARDGAGGSREVSIPIRHNPVETGFVSFSIPAGDPYWWSQWLGYHWAEHWPYLFVFGVNWIYVIPTMDGSYWFYHFASESWIWTKPGYYPIVFRATGDSQGWINIVSGLPAG